jgi:uncharacterized protein (DUF433 family)
MHHSIGQEFSLATVKECIVKMQNSVTSKVVSNPGILGGMPVVEGTRVPAATVMAEVKAGKSKFHIFESYPTLPLDGVEACIKWDKLGRP